MFPSWIESAIEYCDSSQVIPFFLKLIHDQILMLQKMGNGLMGLLIIVAHNSCPFHFTHKTILMARGLNLCNNCLVIDWLSVPKLANAAVLWIPARNGLLDIIMFRKKCRHLRTCYTTCSRKHFCGWQRF